MLFTSEAVESGHVLSPFDGRDVLHEFPSILFKWRFTSFKLAIVWHTDTEDIQLPLSESGTKADHFSCYLRWWSIRRDLEMTDLGFCGKHLRSAKVRGWEHCITINKTREANKKKMTTESHQVCTEWGSNEGLLTCWCVAALLLCSLCKWEIPYIM